MTTDIQNLAPISLAAVTPTEESKPIEWSEPPARKRTGGRTNSKYAAIRAALLDNPGEFAILKSDTKNRSLVYQVNKGVGPWGPAGKFEAQSRTTDAETGTITIWARAVVPSDDSEHAGS